MAKIADRYLEKHKAYNNSDVRIPDLRHGGQFGYAPNLSEVISTTPFTRYPGMFNILPDGDIWKKTLKFLIEVHPKSVTGFNATITLTTASVPIDPSGAEMTPVNDATIEHSKITYTYPMDFVGEPIKAYMREFIRLGIWDPILNRPLISTLGLDNVPDDWTLDMYSWDIIAIEPDVHFRHAVKAWEMFGCHFLTSGPIVGSKDPLNAKNVDELSFESTGTDESNYGTRAVAQKIMNEIKITDANPYNVKSALTDEQLDEIKAGRGGYFSTVQSVKDRQIKLKT